MRNLLLFFTLLFFRQIGFTQNNTIRLETPQRHSSGFASDRKMENEFGVAVKQVRAFDINPVLRDQSSVATGDTMVLNLFEGANFRAVIISSSVDINRVHTIVAKLDKFDFAFCYVMLDEGNASLSLDIPELNQKYVTRLHSSSHVSYLLQLDETRLDYLEGGAAVPLDETSKLILQDPFNEDISKKEADQENQQKKSSAERNLFTGCLDENDPVFIDLLVVYTPAAKNWASTNNGNINTIIAGAVTRANLVVANNNMNITFRLVHSAEINYTEVDANTDLSNVTYGSGVMSEVHNLRNIYAADFVVILTQTEDTGGLGWLLTSKYGSPDWAFCLSRVQQTGWTFTMIHEIGHNMGAHHHKAQLTQPGPTVWHNWPENTWTAGWRWTGTNGSRYCDIMTYTSGTHFEDGLNHTEVPYFSDPLVEHNNMPTGNALDGDNARSVKYIKHIASKYRDDVTLQYCTAKGLNTNYNIANVKFGSIDQDAGPVPYHDFTFCSTDLVPEKGELLSVQITNPFWSNQLLVWIDWNGNNEFTDEGEAVFVSAVGSVAEYMTTVTAPPGTSPGLKRMRIRLHVTSEGPNATPCGESDHGVVHDYLVNVVDTGCYGIVIQKNPEDQNTCANNSSGVLTVKYIGSQPIEFQWEYLNGNDWVNIQDGLPAGAVYQNKSSANLTIDSITTEGEYTYRCVITNCEGENNVFTTPAKLIINPPGTLPATPSAIDGPLFPGSGSIYVFSVKPQANIVYQWTFPDGWTVIAGAESHSATVQVGDTGGKVVVIPINECGKGLPVEMDVKVIDFCQAGALSADYEYISKVEFNTISNASGRSTYTDFSYLSTKVEIGETHPFKITLGEGYTADQLVIWIDWNHNGNFTNPGERVYLSPKGDGPFSGTIKIPNHAVPGYARMRIRLHDTSQGANTNSCDNSSFGEVEDYSIHILRACEKVAIVSQSEDQNMCAGIDTVSFALETTGEMPVKFQWQYQDGDNWLNIGPDTPSGAVFMNQDSSVLSISGRIIQGTHLFRCQLTNCDGMKETVSESFELKVKDVPPAPDAIIGEAIVCENELQQYIVSGFSDVNFHWHFPEGWVVESEQNAHLVSVLAGLAGGEIVVTAQNQCGVSEPLTFQVIVNPIPPIPVISFNVDTEILSSSAPEGNQWHDLSGPIEGATDPTHVPGKTADYFTLVTLNGCVSDTSNVIHVIPSDVDETSAVRPLILYPNPALGYLTVKIYELNLISGKLELYNLHGQKFNLVMTDQNEDILTIDLRDLPAGQYTLIYTDKNGVRYGKFIKGL